MRDRALLTNIVTVRRRRSAVARHSQRSAGGRGRASTGATRADSSAAPAVTYAQAYSGHLRRPAVCAGGRQCRRCAQAPGPRCRPGAGGPLAVIIACVGARPGPAGRGPNVLYFRFQHESRVKLPYYRNALASGPGSGPLPVWRLHSHSDRDCEHDLSSTS